MKELLSHPIKMFIVLGVVLAMDAANSYASSQLRISDGTPANTFTITDQDFIANPQAPADTSAQPGVIGFSGAVGNFMINFSTGLTKPAIGTADLPLLSITSFNSTFNGAGGGTLTLEFTDTDFTPNGPLDFLASIGGTSAGNVNFKTFFDPGNVEFAQTSLLTDSGDLTGSQLNPTHVDMSNIVTPVNNYSLTLLTTIEHTASGQNTSISTDLRGAIVAVPLPAAAWMALPLLGGFGVTQVIRRRRLAA